MNRPQVRTSKKITPMIYAYTTPDNIKTRGCVKIGYTEAQTVEERIREQTRTTRLDAIIHWQAAAIYDDGSYESFRDSDFHNYLEKLGVERLDSSEWFRIAPEVARARLTEFRENRGRVSRDQQEPKFFQLRAEQRQAVEKTLNYAQAHEGGEFLWNAKPRFGKTLATYEFLRRFNAHNVLILTNRPAIGTSWLDDYADFYGLRSGMRFVSLADDFKIVRNSGRSREEKQKRGLVRSPKAFKKELNENQNLLVKGDNLLPDGSLMRLEFMSLQKLKRSPIFGGSSYAAGEIRDKELEYVSTINWDVLVLDESHEGIDTIRSCVALDKIKRRFTLHLSGTPFKALAQERFSEEAIFNWTYVDEQRAKDNWKSELANPYADMPRMNLYAYQISPMLQETLEQGYDHNGQTKPFAFDLGEFFKTDAHGEFTYDVEIDAFLDALTSNEKYPYSTPELREELQHTLWLLDRVNSAKALRKKLQEHEVFGEYKIMLVAGNENDEDEEDQEKSQKDLDIVLQGIEEAQKKSQKTITLSVGKLTVGVTIRPWTATLMLWNTTSAAKYLQAAFRAQNPYRFKVETRDPDGKKHIEFRQKTDAYIFDFDPARTLEIYDDFANMLCADASANVQQALTLEERREHIRETLNFFPVVGQDADGTMKLLDAEKVLALARSYRAQQVVKDKFMCDRLFQNVVNVFRVQAVLDTINQMNQPEKTSLMSRSSLDTVIADCPQTQEEQHDGTIQIGDSSLFGAKIYEEKMPAINRIVEQRSKAAREDDTPNEFANAINEDVQRYTLDPAIKEAEEFFDTQLSDQRKRTIKTNCKRGITKIVKEEYAKRSTEVGLIEREYQRKEKQARTQEELVATREEKKKILAETERRHEDLLCRRLEKFTSKTLEESIKQVKLSKVEAAEDCIKARLRGFARAIPSFLMAYGVPGKTRLENFEENIPDAVFKEVTGITIAQFVMLRDGGEEINEQTQQPEIWRGGLFDPIVFNDSIDLFFKYKEELADYFRENQTGDIFDYIPPQQTNQIFTPKKVVKMMVDKLEEENPGCFDRDDLTFADLYMKSGLYIVEIVKRLFRSPRMKKIYPDDKERLRHIFTRQVYGLAPTEIIYRIAINYIFGFDPTLSIDRGNFKCLDPLAFKDIGQLQSKLSELFPELER